MCRTVSILLHAAGTETGMRETFGSTCHGAGRARSRNNSRNKLDYQQASASADSWCVMWWAPSPFCLLLWLACVSIFPFSCFASTHDAHAPLALLELQL